MAIAFWKEKKGKKRIATAEKVGFLSMIGNTDGLLREDKGKET